MRLALLTLVANVTLGTLVACGDAAGSGDDDEPGATPEAGAGQADAATFRPDAADTRPGPRDSGADGDAADEPDATRDPDAASEPDAGDAEDAAVDASADVYVPDPAALIASAPSGTTTSELGGAVTFTVQLARAPVAPVMVPLASSDGTEASVAPAALVFSADDWATPQTVTVTGLADTLVDGAIAYSVSIGAAVSDDAGYQGLMAPALALVNDDHPLPAYQEVGLSHILSTGQSNAVANGSHPAALTTVQPFHNVSFDVGVMTAKNCDGDGCREYETPQSFVPLREGDVFPLSATPRETMSSSMANQATFLGKNVYFPGTQYTEHDILVSLHGRSGNPYHCLRMGTCTWYAGRNYLGPFEEGLRQVQDAKRLATAAGKSYAVRAVTTIHGESDHHGYTTLYPRNGTDGSFNTITNYADALIEWQGDYERQVQAITGQTLPIPLYVLQLQWTERTYNEVSVDQLRAHERAPGKVIVVAPSYMLTYHNDCLHYAFGSHRRIGEYFGKAYAHTVFTGQAWEPLRPLEVTRNGNVLTVRYHVPVPPIVLDTATVTNPGGYGFSYVDDGGAIGIASVEVIAPDQVRVTLASTPVSGNRRLRYAVAASPVPGCPGPTTGVRGNVRDSDATPSQRGEAPLVNWSVGFQMPVP